MQSPQPNIRQSLGVLQRRGRTVEETEGVKDTTKTWCTESTDQTEVGLQKSERLSRSDLGPLCICYGCIDGYSCAPSIGEWVISDSFACCWDLFPSIGLPHPALM